MTSLKLGALGLARAALQLLIGLSASAPAWSALTATPLTWNIVGLDSNTPTTGPQFFPVGARICSTVATVNVQVDFVWDSANPNVNLRAGSLGQVIFPSIAAGDCADAYFEVEVTRVPAAFDTARSYHILATDFSGAASTPTPRELYVEYLVSQARNSITSVLFGPVGGPLTAVPPGGAMNLVVGNEYDIRLEGGTATGGYEQFAAFINFSNAIFRIVDVSTTYAVVAPPRVVSPNDRLYADACLWENNPSSPNYRACLSTGKAGGAPIATTYTIRIIGGGGTSQTLNTLLYDFSGSSYHYNADFGVGARIANIIDPASAGIAKAFLPATTNVGGVSTLRITLSNPNAGALSGYNFTDTLPAGMTIANPTALSTNGCGTPVFTPALAPGASAINFSNGTVAANSSCVILVNVTTASSGAFLNTTSNLFVGAVDTGNSASATLSVNNLPPPPACTPNIELARWDMNVAQGTGVPPPFTSKRSNVATAVSSFTAAAGATNTINTATGSPTANSWSGSGWASDLGAVPTATTASFFDFTVDSSQYKSNPAEPVRITFNVNPLINWANPSNNEVYIHRQVDGGAFSTSQSLVDRAVWTMGLTALAPGVGDLTTFRINARGRSNGQPTAPLLIDSIVLTGCGVPDHPSLTKGFAPNPIGVGGVSTLAFTLTNPNSLALTQAAFADALPTGVQVAAVPNAISTCGGTWAPSAGATNLNFSGGTIPAAGSCTVQVAVTATTPGPKTNVSESISTLQTGTNIGPTGAATATLTALAPPSIDKTFAPNPILAGGVSTLTFVIVNPNPDHPIASIAFSDTFPVAPAALLVAPPPNASTTGCGAPTFAPVAGAGSIAFSGGNIAAGGTCTVKVDVSAPVVGSYFNTSTVVSHIVAAATFNGNSASDTLGVVPPNPSAALLKQVGATPTGPWLDYLSVAAGANIFYRITVENTGDVVLNSVAITDPSFPTLNSMCSFPTSLPVADSLDEGHIASCIFNTVTPITAASGTTVNTATVNATGAATPVSDNDQATYASTGLTLTKSATPTTYNGAGEPIAYSFLVTNSGFAILSGPVTIGDPMLTVTCPALTTVGDLDEFLDPGESVTCSAPYLTTAFDVGTGSVTNTATASAGGTTSPPSSATITTPTADLLVIKTLDSAGPFAPGGIVSFTVTVTNLGPSAASNVSVSDSDTNLTVVSAVSADFTCPGNAFPCTRASLASGVSATITVAATIDALGTFGNTATATSTTPDPVPGNNSGTDSGSTLSADVSVVKTLTTVGPYTIGQSITYSLLVANAGPSTATSVQVTDTPTNLTITNVSGGGCAALPCTIPNLASGASTTVTVTATIAAAGAFDNSASVSAIETDPLPANNTDSSGNGGVAGSSADVSVVKTLTTTGPFTVGQSITYSLFVANAGPSAATSVQVTDTPSNLTITSVSGGGCAALPCTIPSLANGASVTITVTATINAVGAFDNRATVAATEPDPAPANNTDDTGNNGTAVSIDAVNDTPAAIPATGGSTPSVIANDTINGGTPAVIGTNVSLTPGAAPTPAAGSITMNPDGTITVAAGTTPGSYPYPYTICRLPPNETVCDTANATVIVGDSADLSVTKVANTLAPSVGSNVTFTLTLNNAGPSNATGVVVNDLLPAGYTFVSATPSQGSYVSGTGVWTVGSLANGANATLAIVATVNGSGPYSNTATVSSSTPDPDPSDNSDTETPVPAGAADLGIVKTVNNITPTVGSNVSFTLTLTNTGPSNATGVVVNDLLPAGYTFVSSTPSQGAYVSGTGVWTVGNLANGANATLAIVATVNASGPYLNTATVTSGTPDPDPSDDTDTETPIPVPAGQADLAVLKTGPATISRGQNLTFTIRVENRGPGVAVNARLTDPTPAGLVFVSTAGACSGPFPCALGNMASGEIRNLTATYFVPADYSGPSMIVNTVNALSDSQDPTPGDSASSSSVLVPAGVPSFSAPAIIPVDARWALLLLAGWVMLIAGRRIER